jgi:hypothetical protein
VGRGVEGEVGGFDLMICGNVREGRCEDEGVETMGEDNRTGWEKAGRVELGS